MPGAACADLVAAGLSSPAMGERLFLSGEHRADPRVAHLTKLDPRSRVEIEREVARHGEA